ncbi:MAG: potassium channel protein [Bacteroidota bacterium]
MQKLISFLNDKPTLRNIVLATLLLLVIFTIGTIGYHFLEDMAWFNGFYMTFITISTIGFREIGTLSVEGRIFTMLIFVMGIGVISYIASQTTQLLFENELFARRVMKKRLESLNEHYIICGYGRIGHRIADTFKMAGLQVVIIDHNEQKIDRAKNDGFLYIRGDAQEEHILNEARITKAKAIICTLANDQDNVFTTLVARELQPDIYILVRTNDAKNRNKVLRAGADKVISPYDIGANRMANVILRPHVIRFIESISDESQPDQSFEEVLISPGSAFEGKTLAEIDVRNQYSILIIAIVPDGERIRFNPKSADRVHIGDSLIVMGNYEDIEHFKETACNDTRSLAEQAEHFDETSS